MSKIFKAHNIIFDEKIINITNKENDLDNVYEENFVKKEVIIKDEKQITKEKQNIIDNATQKAKSLMIDAKLEAEEIIKNAKMQIIFDSQKAKEKAIQEGFEEALKKAAQEIELAKQQAKEILKNASIEKEKLLQDAEPQVIELIINIVEKLLNMELELNPGIIINLIRQGLNESSLMGNTNIRVSEQFYNVVLKNKDDILSSVANSSNIEIIKDISLLKADCIIETPFGNIDCSLDEQFKLLKENIYLIGNFNK